MARRDREINIFNIAFLDVITGAMGAFVLLVLLLAPYYSGSAPQSQANQKAAQSAVSDAQQSVQKAQQSVPRNDSEAQQALAQARADLDKAKQQLDALKQQIDQLTSQNDRLTKLDQRQQQQIQQSTKEALDRAEQNMAQADKAVQTGDVEELKRLLAQARADLAAARKELDALNQELKEAQDENAKLQQRLDQAMAAVEDLRRQLEEARRELRQALADRDRWKSYATALSQALDQSAPVPKQWALVDIEDAGAGPPDACANVKLTPKTHLTYSDIGVPPGLGTGRQAMDYVDRGAQTLMVIPFGTQNTPSPVTPAAPCQGLACLAQALNAPPPYHRQYIVTLPYTNMKMLFGFGAAAETPLTCYFVAKFAMSSVTDKQDTLDTRYWSSDPIHVGARPALFSVISPGGNTSPSPDDVATWNKAMQSNGAPH